MLGTMVHNPTAYTKKKKKRLTRSDVGIFGAQCDRKLMRSKELLASLPVPTRGVKDIIKEECSTGTHRKNKTKHHTS